MPVPLDQYPDALVGAIYDAPFSDDPWVKPLELLRVALDSNISCIRVIHKGSNPREYLFAAGPKVSPDAIAEWERQNTRGSPVDVPLGEACVLNWADSKSAEASRPILDRLKIGPSEIGSMAATCVLVSDQAECLLTCMRDGNAAPFGGDELTFLQSIGAHFGRALKIRQELTSARVMSDYQAQALDRLAIAGILVGQNGKAVPLNTTARELLGHGDGLRISKGALHAIDDNDDRNFQAMLRAVLAAKGDALSRAISVTRQNGGRDLGVVVSGRETRSLISNRPEMCALIFVRATEAMSSADIALFQELFSFTKAEARLAVGLATGMRLEDVESQLNIRHNTARAHLRSMFLKADVSRQSELVHLLINSVVPLGREAARNTH
jgi:DNA-binding CsgD family transcriptional regulator